MRDRVAILRVAVVGRDDGGKEGKFRELAV